MTTPIYSINGGSNLPGIIATWQRVQKRRNTDGSIDWQNYAMHTWEAVSMSIANFLTIQALAGQRCSLATTDFYIREQAQTYTEVELLNSIVCQHIGLRATGIRIEFRVNLSSNDLGAFDSGFDSGFEI